MRGNSMFKLCPGGRAKVYSRLNSRVVPDIGDHVSICTILPVPGIGLLKLDLTVHIVPHLSTFRAVVTSSNVLRVRM